MGNPKSKYQSFGKLEIQSATLLLPFTRILSHLPRKLTHSPPARPSPVQAPAKARGDRKANGTYLHSQRVLRLVRKMDRYTTEIKLFLY